MKLLFFFAELLDYFGDHDTETRLMSLYEVTMPEVYAFIMCATVARMISLISHPILALASGALPILSRVALYGLGLTDEMEAARCSNVACMVVGSALSNAFHVRIL